jgi:hypothetical protein
MQADLKAEVREKVKVRGVRADTCRGGSEGVYRGESAQG